MRRSEHVLDKRLWASEPIWWDRQRPSARSCFLTALQLAVEMQPMKCKLARMMVPQTAEGYSMTQLVVAPPHHQAQQPPAKKLRPRQQPTIRLTAASEKGYQQLAMGAAWHPVPSCTTQQPLGALTGESSSLCT